jgi:hypothetical protein
MSMCSESVSCLTAGTSLDSVGPEAGSSESRDEVAVRCSSGFSLSVCGGKVLFALFYTKTSGTYRKNRMWRFLFWKNMQ